ncbi:hypothetical protein OJF2_34660 [Aquisphaera giovannonii]|uniref:Uncharacterized protein n=1 Tax=Aquisphaera giovannonii TaxID=406548 RepID=A0A5B9W4D1_9BACT|nr:hypothetical protein OJF2_34660 [Aquisphaera giovannonii]
MGLGMSYQANPEGCGLIERARLDTELGGMLHRLPAPAPRVRTCGETFATWPAAIPGRRRGTATWAGGGTSSITSCPRTAGTAPGRTPTGCSTGPSAGAPPSPRTRGRRRALRSGTSPPAEAEGIADLPGRLTVETIRARHSPPDMQAGCVCKLVAGREDSDREAPPGYFEALRRFCREVSGRDECVLVCLD